MSQVIHVSDRTATLITVLPLLGGLLVLLVSVVRGHPKSDEKDEEKR